MIEGVFAVVEGGGFAGVPGAGFGEAFDFAFDGEGGGDG